MNLSIGTSVQCITPPTERSTVVTLFEVCSFYSVSGFAFRVVVVHVCNIGFLGVPSQHIRRVHLEKNTLWEVRNSGWLLYHQM
jgi:hypothetical protein